jgi:hypothetical protein
VYKEVLNENTNIFINTLLEVQLWSKCNYVINMLSQPINSFIMKNLYQAKQGTHMNKKKLDINLIQHMWLDLYQERIDQVLLLSIDIYGINLIIRRMFSKSESMKDMKWCVRQDGSWRRINQDLGTINHTSEKGKWGSWRRRTLFDGEGQMDVQSDELSYLWIIIYH